MAASFERILNEDLTKPIDDVFEILCKIGKGSYGSVFKAIHKRSGTVVAIKQVPVDCDLQEIIKEISIMQQCDSQFIVKYYGSYFKQSDLYIIMEYCGAGSVLDLMRLREKTLNEDEIALILQYTLRGLEYLHLKRKIHRDIKAGNILLTTNGNAKLADFGVAGQLSDTMSKRNTVIGSPFWMAPEIIQEIGYECLADIWSVGITAIELAEGKPPYADIHPMRAIFMIPTKPPPSFSNPQKWTHDFIDFVSKCLVKNPQQRSTASELLQHNFIRNVKSSSKLQQLIDEAILIRDKMQQSNDSGDATNDDYSITMCDSNRTVIRKSSTIKLQQQKRDEDTLVESIQNTMIINEDEQEDNVDGTLVTHDEDTLMPATKPQFIQHFEDQDLTLKLKHEIKSYETNKSIINSLNRQDIMFRLKILDEEMEREIEQLRKKYEIKRKPIIDSIEFKKKQPQIF